MQPPANPQHCAFGTACASSSSGQEIGKDICSWCKNLSFDALEAKAETQPDAIHLKDLIKDYKLQLIREKDQRIEKNWLFLCASKDPKYRSDEWRRNFDPQDSTGCSPVRHRGQLCPRCYINACEQGCGWLADFDGDRLGFPCVFEDQRLRRPVDMNWRVGPVDAQGRPNPYWEKKHGECQRVGHRNKLCHRCYTRMCEIRGFGRYFDVDEGILQPGLGL
ncbi:Nn.00g096400.m01.CDS01 [Neocucurbitaria sp. VM-36]